MKKMVQLYSDGYSFEEIAKKVGKDKKDIKAYFKNWIDEVKEDKRKTIILAVQDRVNVLGVRPVSRELSVQVDRFQRMFYVGALTNGESVEPENISWKEGDGCIFCDSQRVNFVGHNELTVRCHEKRKSISRAMPGFFCLDCGSEWNYRRNTKEVFPVKWEKVV